MQILWKFISFLVFWDTFYIHKVTGFEGKFLLSSLITFASYFPEQGRRCPEEFLGSSVGTDARQGQREEKMSAGGPAVESTEGHQQNSTAW